MSTAKRNLKVGVTIGCLVVAAILIHSLPRSITVAEIPGDYYGENDNIEEEIRLAGDGTFTQTIIMKNDSTKRQTAGKWFLGGGWWGQDIDFDGGFMIANRDGEFGPAYRENFAVVLLPVEREWVLFGKPCLGSNEDADSIFYYKN